ncbi:MAG: hypothetical protein D3903_05450 [Candidatus Electrothrix sp. GM3_4]|nr:hypothetical protein [Candidatus Electrothrix sp. GM3_4]
MMVIIIVGADLRVQPSTFKGRRIGLPLRLTEEGVPAQKGKIQFQDAFFPLHSYNGLKKIAGCG